MTQHAWMNDVIGYCLGPVDTDTFLGEYHEKKALIAKRKDPERYLDLLSIERIDELVSSIDLPVGALDLTNANLETPLSREDYSFASGFIDRGAVSRHFQNGATVILPQLHQSDAKLASFCRALEAVLSCHVQTNIYLTPPGRSRASRPTTTTTMCFVLQVSGSKSWRLLRHACREPLSR